MRVRDQVHYQGVRHDVACFACTCFVLHMPLRFRGIPLLADTWGNMILHVVLRTVLAIMNYNLHSIRKPSRVTRGVF